MRAFFDRNRAGDHPGERITAAVRDAYGAGPRGELERMHVARMVEESRSVVRGNVPPTTRRSPVSHRRLMSIAIRSAAAVFAVSAATTGLAFTGAVTLPEPARDALSTIGIDVPDGQTAEVESENRGKSSSDAVHEVINSTPPSERGCEFGQAVSAAASGKTREKDPCDRDDESDNSGEGRDGEHRSDEVDDDHGEQGDDNRADDDDQADDNGQDEDDDEADDDSQDEDDDEADDDSSGREQEGRGADED